MTGLSNGWGCVARRADNDVIIVAAANTTKADTKKPRRVSTGMSLWRMRLRVERPHSMVGRAEVAGHLRGPGTPLLERFMVLPPL
jgi:hypothetical protein